MDIREQPPSSINTDDLIVMYRELYDDIVSTGRVLLATDRHPLAMLANILVGIETAQDSLNRDGLMIETPSHRGDMIIKINKNADHLDKLTSKSITLFRAFGMAPNYRKDSVADTLQDDEDGWE